MGEFANLDEHSVLALIAVMLLMAIFGCASAVLDHWVRAGRKDSRPERTPKQSSSFHNFYSRIYQRKRR
jgi:hypothetical protein